MLVLLQRSSQSDCNGQLGLPKRIFGTTLPTLDYLHGTKTKIRIHISPPTTTFSSSFLASGRCFRTSIHSSIHPSIFFILYPHLYHGWACSLSQMTLDERRGASLASCQRLWNNAHQKQQIFQWFPPCHWSRQQLIHNFSETLPVVYICIAHLLL